MTDEKHFFLFLCILFLAAQHFCFLHFSYHCPLSTIWRRQHTSPHVMFFRSWQQKNPTPSPSFPLDQDPLPHCCWMINRRSLCFCSCRFPAASVRRAKSAATIFADRKERSGVDIPSSSLGIAHIGDSDASGGGGLEALRAGEGGAS